MSSFFKEQISYDEFNNSPSLERPEFFIVIFFHRIKTSKLNILHRVHPRVICTVNLTIILASFLYSNDSLMLHSSKFLKVFRKG